MKRDEVSSLNIPMSEVELGHQSVRFSDDLIQSGDDVSKSGLVDMICCFRCCHLDGGYPALGIAKEEKG